MAAPPGPRSAPPGRPDPAARRIIESLRRYAAASPGLPTAHGMRTIAAVAAELADDTMVDAHDVAGASWSQIARTLGLQPGTPNGTAPRVRARRAAAELKETGTG